MKQYHTCKDGLLSAYNGKIFLELTQNKLPSSKCMLIKKTLLKNDHVDLAHFETFISDCIILSVHALIKSLNNSLARNIFWHVFFSSIKLITTVFCTFAKQFVHVNVCQFSLFFVFCFNSKGQICLLCDLIQWKFTCN